MGYRKHYISLLAISFKHFSVFLICSKIPTYVLFSKPRSKMSMLGRIAMHNLNYHNDHKRSLYLMHNGKKDQAAFAPPFLRNSSISTLFAENIKYKVQILLAVHSSRYYKPQFSEQAQQHYYYKNVPYTFCKKVLFFESSTKKAHFLNCLQNVTCQSWKKVVNLPQK